jgi:predicted acyl esterase
LEADWLCSVVDGAVDFDPKPTPRPVTGLHVSENTRSTVVTATGARDVSGLYYADHQWLAKRGYAVLSVNYRGSTRFGTAFVNAANLEWAGKMHDDLIDAVDWAIAQGVADRARVAIMGTS